MRRKKPPLPNKLEEQMVSAGYKTNVSSMYGNDLPQVKGRATGEMILSRNQTMPTFNVNGQNYPTGKLIMVIDGYLLVRIFVCLYRMHVCMCTSFAHTLMRMYYSTGGNFVDLVQNGLYE